MLGDVFWLWLQAIYFDLGVEYCVDLTNEVTTSSVRWDWRWNDCASRDTGTRRSSRGSSISEGERVSRKRDQQPSKYKHDRNSCSSSAFSVMDGDEPMAISQANSRSSSRASNRRSPMAPPPIPSGVTLNRPLGLSSSQAYYSSLPRSGSGLSQIRDYSCPPISRSALGGRRGSSGVLISSMFGSRFRHLQKLHTDAFALGLNSICFPGLPVGTMFRSSLPATPVSTPIHREAFTHITEQALRDRLCKTPSMRKTCDFAYGPPPPSLDVQHFNDEMDRESRNSIQPMDTTGPSSPIPELAEN